jgi:hypothetical protein
MAKRREVPDGVNTSAKGRIVGVLQKQRGVRFAPLEQQDVNRVVLEVGGMDFPVIARKELAHTLSGMETGWTLAVEGRLTRHTWTTQDGRKQIEIVLESERIERVQDAGLRG